MIEELKEITVRKEFSLCYRGGISMKEIELEKHFKQLEKSGIRPILVGG